LKRPLRCQLHMYRTDSFLKVRSFSAAYPQKQSQKPRRENHVAPVLVKQRATLSPHLISQQHSFNHTFFDNHKAKANPTTVRSVQIRSEITHYHSSHFVPPEQSTFSIPSALQVRRVNRDNEVHHIFVHRNGNSCYLFRRCCGGFLASTMSRCRWAWPTRSNRASWRAQ